MANSKKMTIEELMALGDAEFEKLAGPPDVAPVDPATEPATNEEHLEGAGDDQGEGEDESASTEPNAESGDAAADDSNVLAEDDSAGAGQPPNQQDTPPPTESQQAEPAENPETDSEPEPVDARSNELEYYKAFYEQVTAPFKANGTMIQLHTADEVIRLMQMGANYTQKMQALKPQRKLLMMLENNDLLDEGKLSFLIDLSRKDPEAIKKLLVDAGIDPIDVDTSKVNYKPTSYTVSDQEVAFQTAIEDLKALDGGQETLQSMYQWDDASKKVLMENPGLFQIIHQHRTEGIYDKVASEVARLKAIGGLSSSTPFLVAYKQVGDALFNEERRKQSQTPDPKSAPTQRTPVATRPARTAAPKAATDNRVRAAAPTRNTPKVTTPVINYLALSDEEFEKLPPPV